MSQSNANSSKRFCTLNICFRPEGGQPWASIIFRGQGLRLSQTEKQAWDEDVDVYFQTNAWADIPFCVKWVDNTLKKTVQEEQEPFALFCNNLEDQKAEVFKESVEALSGIVWYCVANATDKWQPIDAGYAQLLKALIKQEFFNWLDDEDNIDKWYGETVFSASEKQVGGQSL